MCSNDEVAIEYKVFTWVWLQRKKLFKNLYPYMWGRGLKRHLRGGAPSNSLLWKIRESDWLKHSCILLMNFVHRTRIEPEGEFIVPTCHHKLHEPVGPDCCFSYVWHLCSKWGKIHLPLIRKSTHCPAPDKETSPWSCVAKYRNTHAVQEVLYMEKWLLELQNDGMCIQIWPREMLWDRYNFTAWHWDYYHTRN